MLVTGGAGFIGRWIVKRLIERGHRVAVLDNLENGSRENLAEFAGQPGFLGLLVGSVEDARAVSGAFAAGVDLCIHAAAQINVRESLENPGKTIRANLGGTWQMLEHCRRSKCRFVYLSTCMVYDELVGAGATNEQYPLRPCSPYAATKLAAERLAQSHGRAYDLPVVILRPFNTYGPFQKSGAEGGVVSAFLQRKLLGQKLPLFGGGAQTRDLLYVEDCADFVLRASLSDGAVGEVFNAGTGQETSVHALAERIAGPEFTEAVPHLYPRAEVKRMRCGFGKAYGLLGWVPQVSLEEGLRRTEHWLKQRPGAEEDFSSWLSGNITM